MLKKKQKLKSPATFYHGDMCPWTRVFTGGSDGLVSAKQVVPVQKAGNQRAEWDPVSLVR